MSDLVELKRTPQEWAEIHTVTISWSDSLGGYGDGGRNNYLTVLADAKADIATLAAELSRLSALVAEWRPMESAPRDGTEILAFVPSTNEMFVVWWKDAWAWRYQVDANVIDVCEASHWMPLPIPPVSQLKDTTNADK